MKFRVLHLPVNNVTDMRGAIDFATSIDPDVRLIICLSVRKRWEYRRTDNGEQEPVWASTGNF